MYFERAKVGETEPAPVAVDLSRIGKCYRMYEKPSHRLWQGLTRRQGFHKDFWALRDVSLQIGRGETFGVIGKNGSGKSTLLQIIAGTLTPSEGTLEVNGRVAALLELGSGFNPDFTGRENVYLNATILGLTRNQVEARIQSILEFAEIGEFIDQPVRSYSSGMAVRLAFAVIAHVDADILIIDEALSVGDAFFSQKCMRFLREFQKHGTLLFVSHDAAAVTSLCDRAVWLENGQVRMIGRSRAVVERYMAQQHAASRHALEGDNIAISDTSKQRPDVVDLDSADFRQEEFSHQGILNRISLFEFDPEKAGVEFGAGAAKIVAVQLLSDAGEAIPVTSGGEIIRLRITVQAIGQVDNLIFGFYVKDRLGQRLFGDNTEFSTRERPISAAPGQLLKVDFVFRMPIMPMGSYMVDAAVASGTQDSHTQQHWIHDAVEFKAVDRTMKFGLIGIPMHRIDVLREES